MKTFTRTPQYLNWQRLKAAMLLGLAPTLAVGPLAVQAQDTGPQLEEVRVTARQIVEQLDELDATEREVVATYERATRNRVTVLTRIERLR